MVAIQYSPYNMGGDIIWVKNKENIEIPVVTAKFSIWSGLFDNPLCGGPDYVAALINRDAAKASKQKDKEKADNKFFIILMFTDHCCISPSRYHLNG